MALHPFDDLTPAVVIDAVERLEFVSDRRFLALNSYENRVYQVGIEGGAPVVVKFYRPGRWNEPAILEEHEFALELAAAEIPVVAPIRKANRTLFEYGEFRYAVYERHGGWWPELGISGDRQQMGRFLGRIHGVGRKARFNHRPALNCQLFGEEPVDYLLDGGWIPAHLEEAYATLAEDLLWLVRERFEDAEPTRTLRLHGDCHRGNVLWTDVGPHFVDLDDCMMGPAMQDIWMLLSGSRGDMETQLGDLLNGYLQFEDFDPSELRLIEPLRTLRMIHYAGWLARRWDDPAFPLAFPWFGETRYWEQHILDLREQLAAMNEPVLDYAPHR